MFGTSNFPIRNTPQNTFYIMSHPISGAQLTFILLALLSVTHFLGFLCTLRSLASLQVIQTFDFC